MPHVTEEIWQTVYGEGRPDAFESIHTKAWPAPRGYEADLEAGETAMEVISALRRYKSERQLPLNEPLESVAVHGPISGFETAIQDVTHVQDLEVLEEPPEITTEVASIDLEYATLGPKYGAKVGEIDAAIDAGEFEITDDGLSVAGETLADDLFEVEYERTYSGSGTMTETESAVVIVDDAA